ncbi:hypothetical protein Bca52824_004836 [Brassica carinata]|uniref:Membrane-bound transcription factor site-1 protease-like N-terminal domain-containing protein n=1 Tax=Brassica carinata TaxID=52824 RepID=A0A8X7WPQ5_BRACI|nr:hypothetical protein Bca52824_004836 [Brassica carinata]
MLLAEASSSACRSYILVALLSVFLFWRLRLNPQNAEIATHTNYIIRFKHYEPAETHRIYLESEVRSGGWGWIERDNPAAKYPTDFGVLWIEESGREAVVEEIERLAMVKDVNVEFRYQRVLLGGSFLDGEKRPGRSSRLCLSKKELIARPRGLLVTPPRQGVFSLK